jgi:hypothetical protein
VAGALYASAVCLLVVFAARVFAYYKNLPALALTGGALLFFVSDALLAWFNTVRPMTKKALIAVMSTYITAQAAIVSAYAALA